MAQGPAGAHAEEDCDECLGCLQCAPVRACRQMSVSEGFTLVGYGRVQGRELVQPHELIADAHGTVLPDGRAVTYCDDPHGLGEPELQVWPSVAEAAHYWGSWVLWSSLRA